MPIKTSLTKRKCVPCEGGIPPLTLAESRRHLKSLDGWSLASGGKSIQAEYLLKNFAAAVGLIQKIAWIAEGEGHHPDLHLVRYKRLTVVLTTHAIDGLSLNDFIVAAKIQKIAGKPVGV